MDFANVLLNIAGRITPSDRRDWLAAMKAEQQEVRSGRLRWAVGCLTVALGWRVAKDGLYASFICASLWFLAATPFFVLEAQLMPAELWDLGLYPPLVYLVAIGLVLGLYRPRLAVYASIGVVVFYDVQATFETYLWVRQMPEFRDQTLWAFLQDLQINNAHLLIGFCAHLGACLCGGLAGRWISKQLKSAKR